MLGLPADQRVVLNPGREPGRQGHIGVIAAGTGLGEALLHWDGQTHRAVPSEGGHNGFSPRSEEEDGLLQFLRHELGGHVSTERVVSGLGLHNVYRYLRERSGEPAPEWLVERLHKEDPSAVVGEVAMAGDDPVCVRSLELFVSLYGSEAGDLALRYVSLGGVLIGGGIAPKILPWLQRGEFMRAFADKGRFREMLEGIEVSVCLEPRAPLLGAASSASLAG